MFDWLFLLCVLRSSTSAFENCKPVSISFNLVSAESALTRLPGWIPSNAFLLVCDWTKSVDQSRSMKEWLQRSFRLLCPRVFSPASAILKNEMTLGTRLSRPLIFGFWRNEHDQYKNPLASPMIIALQENIVRISFKRNAWEVASTSPSFKVFMASYLELLGADPELMYVVIFCRCRNIQKHRTISIF